MNAVRTILIATSLLMAGVAYAQEAPNIEHQARYSFNNDIEQPNTEPNKAPERTRAQVLDELTAALAAGEICYGESEYPLDPITSNETSRAQVQQELADAIAAGRIWHGENEQASLNSTTSRPS